MVDFFSIGARVVIFTMAEMANPLFLTLSLRFCHQDAQFFFQLEWRMEKPKSKLSNVLLWHGARKLGVVT